MRLEIDISRHEMNLNEVFAAFELRLIQLLMGIPTVLILLPGDAVPSKRLASAQRPSSTVLDYTDAQRVRQGTGKQRKR